MTIGALLQTLQKLWQWTFLLFPVVCFSAHYNSALQTNRELVLCVITDGIALYECVVTHGRTNDSAPDEFYNESN